MELQALPFFSVIRHIQVTDWESWDMDDSGELPPSVSRSGRPVKRSSERIIAPTPNKKKKSHAAKRNMAKTSSFQVYWDIKRSSSLPYFRVWLMYVLFLLLVAIFSSKRGEVGILGRQDMSRRESNSFSCRVPYKLDFRCRLFIILWGTSFRESQEEGSTGRVLHRGASYVPKTA